MKKCIKRFSALALAVALAVGSRGMLAIGAQPKPLFAHAEKNGTYGADNWKASLVSAGTLVTATTNSSVPTRDEAYVDAYGISSLGEAEHDAKGDMGQYYASATVSFTGGVIYATSTHWLNSVQIAALSVQ